MRESSCKIEKSARRRRRGAGPYNCQLSPDNRRARRQFRKMVVLTRRVGAGQYNRRFADTLDAFSATAAPRRGAGPYNRQLRPAQGAVSPENKRGSGRTRETGTAPDVPSRGARRSSGKRVVTRAPWLILPVVICLSQRLSHASLSTYLTKVKPQKAH